MMKLFSRSALSSSARPNQSSNARKVDESQSKPIGEPIKFKESAVKKLMKRLSMSTTTGSSSSSSSWRKSFVMGRRQSRIKDAKASTELKTTDSSSFEVVMGDTPVEIEKGCNNISNTHNDDKSSKMIKLVKPNYSQQELKQEKEAMERDLGVDISAIIYNVAKAFEPIIPKSGLIDPSKLSESTISLCGSAAPAISIPTYLSRIVENINFVLNEPDNDVLSAGARCLLIATIYIKKMKKAHPDFEINGLNIHRLLLVTVVEAVKVNEDVVPANKFLAEVGGVDLAQLTILESAFCNLIKHKLIVTPDELEEAYKLYYKRDYVIKRMD